MGEERGEKVIKQKIVRTCGSNSVSLVLLHPGLLSAIYVFEQTKELVLIGYTVLLLYWLNYSLTSNAKESHVQCFSFELVGGESVGSWSQWAVSQWPQSPPTRITFYLVWATFSTVAELGFLVSMNSAIISDMFLSPSFVNQLGLR